MKLSDFLAIVLILVLLSASLYLLWLNFPTEEVQLKEYKAQLSNNLPLQSSQFFPNMRYPKKEITYFLSPLCSQKKQEDFVEATKILEQKTTLKFSQSQDEGDIEVTCSNISPQPEEEGHFIAGEGGPSLFINTSLYGIIISGKIALYRQETCPTPQIALHELLHALGFDHNSNEQSIMFPITNCKQKLDQFIIDEINDIYSQQSLSDLIVENIQATKTGRDINFEIIVVNQGLKKIENSSLELMVKNEVIRNFELGDVDIGAKRKLTVSNLRMPRNTEQVTFVVRTTEPEISKNNNAAEISLQG